MALVDCLGLTLVSPLLGPIIDRDPSRLRPVVASITVNRVTLFLGCVAWLIIVNTDTEWLKQLIFVFALFLSAAEMITRNSNMLSFERDWIPTLAKEHDTFRDDDQKAMELARLNTAVWRIALLCKAVAPFVASGTLAITSITFMIYFVGLYSVVAAFIEVYLLCSVWSQSKSLQEVKTKRFSFSPAERKVSQSLLSRALSMVVKVFSVYNRGAAYCFSTNVWVPSISVALLYSTVLVWTGTLVTWLLNIGFSYADITAAKAVSAIFEFGSTLVFPIIVSHFRHRRGISPLFGLLNEPLSADSYLAPRQPVSDISNLSSATSHPDADLPKQLRTQIDDTDDLDSPDDFGSARGTLLPTPSLDFPDSFRRAESSTTQAVITTGLLSIFLLLITSAPAVFLLFSISSYLPGDSVQKQGSSSERAQQLSISFSTYPFLTVSFTTFLALSLFARYVFDLSVRQVVISRVPASHRSEYGGVEIAIYSAFDLARVSATAFWHQLDDFKWQGLASLVATAVATVLFSWWSRKELLSGVLEREDRQATRLTDLEEEE